MLYSISSTPCSWRWQDLKFCPNWRANANRFCWGDVSGHAAFAVNLHTAYNEVIHWRKILFLVPTRKAGKVFDSEFARLFQAYADCSSLEPVALEATTTMAIPLLQNHIGRAKVTCLFLKEDWIFGIRVTYNCCLKKVVVFRSIFIMFPSNLTRHLPMSSVSKVKCRLLCGIYLNTHVQKVEF